ncbi:hypothetical protein AVEN_241576-1 [Araneus ventricosus]|uniref:Ig-like domain-containing protein n=1 Tax=Araneus ventricosus TaxID=182803 RepID=A0A4Y2H503_ARAVE|nr:hypothetical protein AVEN_241576-1 [Araneus ventricosus]
MTMHPGLISKYIILGLACPKDWLFFYQLPVGAQLCIKAFSGPASGVGARNETATCLELGSQVADIQDFVNLYVYMSGLNISGIPSTDPKNFCQTKYIESVLGGHLKENVTCLDKIDICARDTREIALRPKVSPDFSDSVPSATIRQTLLTCEVPFKSRDFSEVEPQLHYTWYVDEIPIRDDSRVLNVSSYPETVRRFSFAHRQGTYRCVVAVEGMTARFPSQYVNYFHSDVTTYIVYMQTDLKSVLNVDFSRPESFDALMRLVDDSMADVIKGIFAVVREPEWDYQMSWKNEENVTVQLLFYYFDDESYRYFNESNLKRKLLPNLSFNSSISLEIDRADTCLESAVPSSGTSHNAFKWRRTQQTKLAVSEPMCLNGKPLILFPDFTSVKNISADII